MEIFISAQYPFTGQNPVFTPVLLEWLRYGRYLNRNEILAFLYRSRFWYGKHRLYRLVRYEIDSIVNEKSSIQSLLLS